MLLLSTLWNDESHQIQRKGRVIVFILCTLKSLSNCSPTATPDSTQHYRATPDRLYQSHDHLPAVMLYKWVSRGWRAGSVAKSTRLAEDLSWFPAPTLDSCKCHIHLSRASQTRHSCSQIQTGVCIGIATLGHAFMLFPKRVVANTCPTPSSKLVTRWEWGSE